MNFTVGELAQITGGKLLQGNPDQLAGPICTDTRSLQRGETFIGIYGKNYRGSDFFPDALKKGALGFIFQEQLITDRFPEEGFLIDVEDTVEALGRIAQAWRLRVNPKVIAVTGSAGKTTTKEMTAFICRGTTRMVATEGNLNNLIGLPTTLLRLKMGDELAIIETGMNVIGELAELTRICIPDIAILTNIGNAHIGNFGSLENLTAGEAEILGAMPPEGTALINGDCENASQLEGKYPLPKNVVYFGQGERHPIRATNIELVEPFGYSFDLTIRDRTERVQLHVYGRYQIYNALGAAAGASFLGIDLHYIAQCLSTFEAPRMRSETEWCDGVFVVCDCYNASPDAMILAVHSLNDVAGIKRRVALLGDMYELGTMDEFYHRKVGVAVAESKYDLLCTVGKSSLVIHEEAKKGGIDAIHFTDGNLAAEFLAAELKSGDGMIVKGSRGARLENVLGKFKELRSAMRDGTLISEKMKGHTDV